VRGDDAPDVRPRLELRRAREVPFQHLAVRFALGAAISVAAALIGTAVGTRFGGMFLAFPAILPASLTLIEHEEGVRRADRCAVGAVLGGAALLVFAGGAEAALGHLAAGVALAVATVAWAGAACVLYIVLACLRPDDCDRHND
jgi:uncharacterized protein DUF3147